MRLIAITALLAFVLTSIQCVYAQQYENECALHSPYQVIVGNYLKFEIPPQHVNTFDNHVDLELTWGHSSFSRADKTAILQIELLASKIEQNKIPLNISIVVDRSASMREHQRMEKVKIALKEFIKMLRPDDYVSIVVYDDNASTLLPAQRISPNQLSHILNLIDNIKLGASTNMVSGMLLGYKEVLRNYNPHSANRVILLTDGIANLGITDPEQIILQSRNYNQKGIDISTIGVGADINFSLLNNIAKEGRGLSHFMGDCDSVRDNAIHVFKEDLNDMLSLVKKPVIEISFPRQFSASSMSDPSIQEHKKTISIPLNDLHQGMSQALLVQFSAEKTKLPKEVYFAVKLTYFDVIEQKMLSKTRYKHLVCSNKANADIDMLENNKVKSNYYISLMAGSLKKSVMEYEQKRYHVAYKTINNCLADIDGKLDFTDINSHQYTIHQLLLSQQQMLFEILKAKA